MGLADILLISLIVGGAIYIVYRYIRKKGHCPGCGVETCETKEK